MSELVRKQTMAQHPQLTLAHSPMNPPRLRTFTCGAMRQGAMIMIENDENKTEVQAAGQGGQQGGQMPGQGGQQGGQMPGQKGQDKGAQQGQQGQKSGQQGGTDEDDDSIEQGQKEKKSGQQDQQGGKSRQ
jgi:hypothetical protein